MPVINHGTAPLRTILAAVLTIGMALGLSHAAAAEPETPPAPPAAGGARPTIFVVGDSTARNNAGGAQGWGDPFAAYFDPARVSVLNRAMAGRSSRTYIAEGRWDNVLKELKAGDFVLIQLGHNDGGPIDTGRARASLPGLGDETREVTKADGSKEVVHTYGWYLRKIVADTKAKGATPILLSLTVRNIWKDGKVERGSGRYGPWISEVARAQGVPFVDVTSIIADRYERMGQENVKAMFGPDYVHTSPAGADLNAASVVAGLKGLTGSPFASLLSEKGRAVETYGTPAEKAAATAPAAPDVAASVRKPTLWLIGDSTVKVGTPGQRGWGDPVAAYFDAEKITVANRARGGRSSRTFLTEGLWDGVLAEMKPGDFVLMQFGHNDGGRPEGVYPNGRASLKGGGGETREVETTPGKTEVVHTYGWYLRRYVADAKSKGATPIVLSPIPRNRWAENGTVQRASGDYGRWAREAAEAEGAAFVDLNEIVARQYDAMGKEKVDPLFGGDWTHTNAEGATLNAASVIAGLKGLKDGRLAAYLSPLGNAVAAYAPAVEQRP